MNNRKMVRLIAIILAIILAGSLIVSAVSYMALGTAAESELQDLQEQAEALVEKEAEAEARINALEYEQLTVLEKKAVLDNQVVVTEEKVNIYEQQLEACARARNEINEEIEEARQEEESLRTLLGNRVCSTEENGIISYFSILFQAQSYGDLISRFDFFRQMLEYDEQIYTDYNKAKLNTVRIEEKLTAIDEIEAEAETAIAGAQDELREESAYAASVFAADISTAENYTSMCDTIAENQDDWDTAIAQSDSAIVRSTQRSIMVGLGYLVSPVSGGLSVTEPFGTLLNEEFSYYRMHNGIDIETDYGADVLASDYGTVTLTGHSDIYGNYIVISHGNGFMTVYAHLGDINVEAGDEVEQSQVIGSVGSTGAAAAPTLHYEVRLNDVPVNPLLYLV